MSSRLGLARQRRTPAIPGVAQVDAGCLCLAQAVLPGIPKQKVRGPFAPNCRCSKQNQRQHLGRVCFLLPPRCELASIALGISTLQALVDERPAARAIAVQMLLDFCVSTGARVSRALLAPWHDMLMRHFSGPPW